MSNASPILNGENTGGVAGFSTDASVNMVAAIHDHISCAKPVQVDPFNAQDSKAGILSYSCEFDHMYASLTEGTTVQKDGAEVKHLKELLLLHLDLIQQQSEQLVTKDKQLSALRQENETLRQRLERMDRRVTLQKHREISEVFVPTSGGCISPRAVSPPFTTGCSSVFLGSSGTSIIECDTETITVPLETIDSSIHNINIGNNCENFPITDNQNIITPRSSWEIAKRRRRGDLENSGSASGSGIRRKRLASWTSSINSDVLSHDGRNSLTKETTGEHKRMQKKLRTKGSTTKKDAVLTTNTLYYTPIGESELPWGTEETKLNGHVEVPSWRLKVYTSCYTMEGTENLDDEVFNKRHQRLEIDERRRKRWDVQRIREQRQVEKLKQREMASTRRGSGGSNSRHSDGEEPLSSLWPQLDDAEYLEITESVPVAAFGLPITKFIASEFSLPWLTSARCKTPSHTSSRRRAESKR
ncbi:uncharacterized protein LOC111869474 [Cryptotermes secundus]|uniref:uncharacterized protein LOC111869474 n=1 Tax=Cryptotermes secundus TaxID=105785 RepID=UPI000CD7D2C1|nr:uncharacterized protein LOC111869474 [Cryptotermes secundus]